MADVKKDAPTENPQVQGGKATEGSVVTEQYLAEDFAGLADNVYEAIIVIAKRARQIGDAQKREIDRQIGTIEMVEAPEEEPPDEDVPEPEFYHYEKPTVLAMQEMADRKLKFDYKK